MLVKPAPGRAIRDPGTMQLVPDTGALIDPTNLFWARVLADEDVVELSEEEANAFHAEEPADAAPPAPAPRDGDAAPPSLEPTPAPAAGAKSKPVTPAASGSAAPSETEGSDA